jgi:TolB-like protein/tRNA A-37 threonylcarbamoyl transferase component Bud32
MIGRTISHYEILAEIGGGGMGVVYKARDTKLERPVALKFLPPELTRDPDAKRRFVHEAKAASALQHHNICTIHEIDETDDGGLFICMDCYEGQTLKQKIARAPVPIDAAVDIVSQVAEGLSKAHEAGMVHRDIKPANILITSDGVVKIVDFGLAKLAGQTKLTKTGTTVGTVAYMSPEQAKGESLDHRTDIWSLGVVLYELITGQLPFKSDYEQAVVYSILNETPESITQSRSDAPKELERIVARAMEKQPDKRYQSAKELLADLAKVRERVLRKASPAGANPRTGGSRRGRRIAWLGAGVAVVALAAYVGVTRFEVGPKESEPSGRKKIAVLPFENLGASDDEYFADGMTEEITSRLAAVEGLGVISRTSVVNYDRTGKSMREIGDDLNADYVLEGTVRWDRRAGGPGSVRITPQLIRVADDTHVWSDRYDRELQDVFGIQSDIAKAIVEQMGVTLLDRERRILDARPTENMDAYQAYLRGLEYTRELGGSGEAKLLAQRMFERAVELDPAFALAYAWLSNVHSYMYYVAFDRSHNRAVMAKEAVDHALRLKPGLAEAHMALGSYYYRCEMDFGKSLEQFEIARRDLPSDAYLHYMVGNVKREEGEWEASLDAYKTAFELDPRSGEIGKEIAFTYMFQRKYEEAVAYWDRCISLSPEHTGAYETKAQVYWLWHGDTRRAGEILDHLPDVPQARDPVWIFYNFFRQDLYERDYENALRRIASLPVDMDIYEEMRVYFPKTQLRGLVYYLMGNTEAARASFDSARVVLETEVENRPDRSPIHSSLGIAYAVLGQKDSAIREGKLAVDRLVSRASWYKSAFVQDLAFIYVLVGDYDAALDQIEYLLSVPCEFSVGLLKLDPRWDPLRDHPRYQKLLKEYQTQSEHPGS